MKVHKWAKEIKHFVNGGEVERRSNHDDKDDPWWPVDYLDYFSEVGFKFRIKPDKPKVRVAIFLICGSPHVVTEKQWIEQYHALGVKNLSPWFKMEQWWES